MDKISVIIVNWNVADSLRRCLDSVHATKYPNLEIIVIDNGSTETFDQATIKNTSNLGFPKAVNQGLKVATGDYILVLNPDTRIPSDFFKKALELTHAEPSLGVMGPKFQDQGSVFPEPSVINAFREYWLGHKGLTQKYIPNTNTPIEVTAVSGACMFIPKKVIQKIGFLTEKVFMYYEDLDYCRRVRQAGLKVIFNPQITIVHEHGRSSAQNPQSAKYLNASSLWYNGPIKYYLITFIIWSSQKKLIFLALIILSLFGYQPLSNLDVNRISTRRGYYPKTISRFFQNKLIESFTLSRKKVFSVLSFDIPFRALGYE